jgi:predicted nucleotidyltransferase
LVAFEYIHKIENFMTDQMQAVRDTVIEILRENGVKRAAFFGSIVRGEMDEESDIDILIEFEGRKSLLDLAHLKNELEDATNGRVDVLTYKSLHTRLKDRILAEQVPILGLIEDHSERTEAVLEDLPFIA